MKRLLIDRNSWRILDATQESLAARHYKYAGSIWHHRGVSDIHTEERSEHCMRCTIEKIGRRDGPRRLLHGHAQHAQMQFDLRDSSFMTTKDSQTPIDSRLRETLTNSFGVPAWFWTKKSQEASGYWYCNDSEAVAGSSSKSSRHVSVFRFIIKYSTGAPWAASEPGRADSYDWHRMSFATLWCPSASKAALLCIDLPAALEKNISQALLDLSSDHGLISHPFAYHEVILEHVIDVYDQGERIDH